MIHLGLSVDDVWKDIKTASKQFAAQLPGDVKRVIERNATDKVEQVVLPVAKTITQEKTQRVVSKGNVALYALGGLALGALIAGGGWSRRAVGGLAVGGAGTIVAFKMGLLYDKL